MKIEKIMQATKNNDDAEYFPIFKKNGVIIDEKSEDCFWLIPHKENAITINRTAYGILKMCDGQNSIKDIIEKLIEEYGIQFDIIKRDLVSTLYSLFYVNLIVWKKGKNYFLPLFEHKYKEHLFKKLELKDIKKLIKNIQEDNSVISVRYDKKNMYTDLNIQVRLSMGKDLYFACYDKEEIEMALAFEPIISIRPSLEFISYHAELLYFNPTYSITSEEFDIFAKWCINWYLESNNLKPKNKREIIYTQITDEIVSNGSKLKKIGFDPIGKMSQENGNTDVIVYEKQLIY